MFVWTSHVSLTKVVRLQGSLPVGFWAVAALGTDFRHVQGGRRSNDEGAHVATARLQRGAVVCVLVACHRVPLGVHDMQRVDHQRPCVSHPARRDVCTTRLSGFTDAPVMLLLAPREEIGRFHERDG